jgi:hypothetical protein
VTNPRTHVSSQSALFRDTRKPWQYDVTGFSTSGKRILERGDQFSSIRRKGDQRISNLRNEGESGRARYVALTRVYRYTIIALAFYVKPEDASGNLGTYFAKLF